LLHKLQLHRNWRTPKSQGEPKSPFLL
jgi:hypothetical protein